MKTFKSAFPFKYFVILLAGLFISGCEKDPFDASSGTFTDKRDGHEYKWVKIGEQIWMAENLAYLPEQPCAPDSQCGVWVYGYEGEGPYGTNYFTYGCLYDWETAQKVCPDGWHLPSDEEWMELEGFLGMDENDLFQETYRGVKKNIAGKLMDSDNAFWGDSEKNNESGFSARPGGRRDIWHTYEEFYFRSLGKSADFWTKTSNGALKALNRSVVDLTIERESRYKNAGFSVRCLKN